MSGDVIVYRTSECPPTEMLARNLTIHEVARRVNRAESTVLGWIRSGKIDAFREWDGHRVTWLIPELTAGALVVRANGQERRRRVTGRTRWEDRLRDMPARTIRRRGEAAVHLDVTEISRGHASRGMWFTPISAEVTCRQCWKMMQRAGSS